MMKLITKRGIAADVANSWKRQYFARGNGWGELNGGGAEAIYNALVALGEHPAPADIARIIGNESWTRLSCDECEDEVHAVVQLGQEPDCESRTANVCVACLSKASKLASDVLTEDE